MTNLGRSIGTLGLLAPGQSVTSLAPEGPLQTQTRSGTSVAVPFVTGAAALLWSEFPKARAVDIKGALLGPPNSRRARVVPPLLDVTSAYSSLQIANLSKKGAYCHAVG
jgi:subtilisin family serine protease